MDESIHAIHQHDEPSVVVEDQSMLVDRWLKLAYTEVSVHDVWTATSSFMTSPWMNDCVQSIPTGMLLGSSLALIVTIVATLHDTVRCILLNKWCCNRRVGHKRACKSRPASRARSPKASRAATVMAASVAADIAARMGGVVGEHNGVQVVHYHLTEAQKKLMKSLDFIEFWTTYATKVSRNEGVANANVSLYKAFAAYKKKQEDEHKAMKMMLVKEWASTGYFWE